MPQFAHEAQHLAGRYEIANSYGLFRRMTGVGARPEVVIEGSLTGNDDDWHEFNFIYKPGNLAHRPVVASQSDLPKYTFV